MPNTSDSGTAWDIEIESLQRSQHISAQDAADRVAMSWLVDGDTRALADLLQRGFTPGASLLKFVGLMLRGHDIDAVLPSNIEELAPYQLVAKPRSPKVGAPKDRAKAVRDILISGNVHGLRKGGLTYEDAVTSVEEVLAPGGVSRKTIERAYDRRHPRSTRKPKTRTP